MIWDVQRSKSFLVTVNKDNIVLNDIVVGSVRQNFGELPEVTATISTMKKFDLYKSYEDIEDEEIVELIRNEIVQSG